MSDLATGKRARTVRRWLPRILIWTAVVWCAWLVWPSRFGGGTTMVVVDGNSMVPTYANGDLIVARSDDGYRPGDIVVFKIELPGELHHQALIVHRLIAIDPDGRLTTQGDNRRVADGFSLTTSNIVGRAVLRLPKGGTILRLLSRWWILGFFAGAIAVVHLWPKPATETASPGIHKEQDVTKSAEP